MESLKRKINFTILFMLILAVLLNSCSSWNVLKQDSLRKIEKKPITQIRLKNGEKIETRNYYFVNDTLVIKTSKSLFYSGNERRIAPDEIKQMRVLEIDWGETAVLFVVSAFVTAALIGMSAGLGEGIGSIK
ncbi:MAG: hypothetical protein DWQ10_18385 [Calditrichaeota bacterium]|nr:MAG: hypothetical protein DWQ10_18385 [Calditrichota bacterium]